MKSLIATIIAGSALAVGGCDPANAQGKHDASAPRTSSGQPATGARANGSEPQPAAVVVIVSQGAPAAVEAIARARCEREKRCSNIGPGKNYPTEHACLHEVAADWADDLNAYECPMGVRVPELDTCLAAIRTENCSKPFDSLARLLTCRSSEICKRSSK